VRLQANTSVTRTGRRLVRRAIERTVVAVGSREHERRAVRVEIDFGGVRHLPLPRTAGVARRESGRAGARYIARVTGRVRKDRVNGSLRRQTLGRGGAAQNRSRRRITRHVDETWGIAGGIEPAVQVELAVLQCNRAAAVPLDTEHHVALAVARVDA